MKEIFSCLKVELQSYSELKEVHFIFYLKLHYRNWATNENHQLGIHIGFNSWTIKSWKELSHGVRDKWFLLLSLTTNQTVDLGQVTPLGLSIHIW